MELTDIFLSSNDEFFVLTGLKQDSIIRLHRLFTIPQESILKHLGEVPASIHHQIRDKLKIIFNIPD